MLERGWDWYDILLVTGDAYVDHPSFGTAVIGRVLERAGYRVAVLAQPDWHSAAAFEAMGRPELGFFSTRAISTAWWPTTPLPKSGGARIFTHRAARRDCVPTGR